MPNSQIDMVVRHGDGWRVCGDFDKQDPAGLEAFTWAQQIPVMQRRTDGNPPPQFAEPETVSGQGDLAAGHSIFSSLILKEGGAAAGDGRLVWQHELQIR